MSEAIVFFVRRPSSIHYRTTREGNQSGPLQKLLEPDDVTAVNKAPLNLQLFIRSAAPQKVSLRLQIVDEYRCLEERRQALKTSNESGVPIFVPVCREDGEMIYIERGKQLIQLEPFSLLKAITWRSNAITGLVTVGVSTSRESQSLGRP